jgi:hypothetical protein
MSDHREVTPESHHDEIVDTLLDLQARLRGEPAVAERRVAPPPIERVRRTNATGVAPAEDRNGVTVVYGDLSISESMSAGESAESELAEHNGSAAIGSAPVGSDATVSVSSSNLTAMVGRVEAVLERLDRLESSLHQVMVRSAAAAVAASRGRDDVPDETAVAEELRHLATERLTHDATEG